jgi:hypothetical protein
MHSKNRILPVLINQFAKGYRQDVIVISSSDYLINSNYQDRLKQQFELEPMASDKSIMSQIKAINDRNLIVYADFSEISHFKKQELKLSDFYLTGLLYKYQTSSIDNLSIIRRNYEKRYLLDHFLVEFGTHNNAAEVQELDETYLASMIKLYNHYVATEEVEKSNSLAKMIAKISAKSGIEDIVLEVLSNNSLAYEKMAFLTADIDYKELEKSMHHISPNIYFSDHEVTNKEYAAFLKNIVDSKELALHKQVLYDSTMWFEKFPKAFNKPMVNLYHSHPAYENYPVVNITHESVTTYCKWLTDQYNMQRKRKYTKVRFRLPSETEWEFAASGGKSNLSYGLLNDTIQNENGCYLANLQPIKGKFVIDGGFHTVKVKSYFSNEFDLFNTIGNVAEMIDVKGIAKGGNWYTLPEDSHIQSQLKIDKPDPGIGFRIVMEVIEK